MTGLFFIAVTCAVEVVTAVSVTVEPDVKAIALNDPLLVKVTARNESNRPLPFVRPLSTENWTLEFEVRPPGDKDFWPAAFPRASCPTPPISSDGFDAAAAFVRYQCFFRHRNGRDAAYTFHTKGEWGIRARVLVGKRYYYSAPVTVRVIPPPNDNAAQALDAAADELGKVTGYYGPLPAPAALRTQEKHADGLRGTNAAAMIQNVRLAAAVRDAKTEQELAAALADFDKHRTSSASVRQEYLDLMLANAFLERKDFAATRKRLNEIDASSSHRDYLYIVLGQLDPRRER